MENRKEARMGNKERACLQSVDGPCGIESEQDSARCIQCIDEVDSIKGFPDLLVHSR